MIGNRLLIKLKKYMGRGNNMKITACRVLARISESFTDSIAN